MDAWLVEHLVCPSDNADVPQRADRLVCAGVHSYPIVDGFFSLKAQAGDRAPLPSRYRLVVSCSELLRKTNGRFPALALVADSLYVRSVCRACPEDDAVVTVGVG